MARRSLGVRRVLLAAVSLVALVAPTSARQSCGTVVPAGNVSGTWTLAGSPYCVQGNILVVGLTIEPGVVVRMVNGGRITVRGVLDAQGTGAQRIRFYSPLVWSWAGIFFDRADPACILEHCIVEAANESAVKIVGCTPTIENCVFWNNQGGLGGGLNVTLSPGQRLVVEGCVFSENKAPGSNRGGGGIFLVGDATVRNCTFELNGAGAICGLHSCTATARGGAILAEGSLAIENCHFGQNWTWATAESPDGTARSYGAAIHLQGGTLSVTNSIFACNSTKIGSAFKYSRQGSGIYVAFGTAEITNSTFALGNTEAIVASHAGSFAVRNSILFYNNSGAPQVDGRGTVDYCNIQGGWPSGTGNLSADPAFIGNYYGCPAAHFALTQSSPGVDAGDPSPAYDDLCFPPSLGQPGINSRNDMGAFGGPGACSWGGGAVDPFAWFCVTTPNSVSSVGATISVAGSASVGANDLVVSAGPVPAGKIGFLRYSHWQEHSNYGYGITCINNEYLASAQLADAAGVLTFPIDNTMLAPSGQFVPGCSWNFQVQYRDPEGPTPRGANSTDAVSITFSP